jgi:ADP-ribose pyrophosphatase YjhB (NUDIX family)
MNAKGHALPSSPPRVIVCVGGVVLKDHAALFVRQAYGAMTGVWSIPWGFYEGRGVAGEAGPDAAVLREIKEEAAVHAEIVGLLGVQGHARESGEGTAYIIFLCCHMAGEPTPDGHETDRAAFLGLQQLKAMEEPVDEFCKWIVERVLTGAHTVIPLCRENPYAPHAAYL